MRHMSQTLPMHTQRLTNMRENNPEKFADICADHFLKVLASLEHTTHQLALYSKEVDAASRDLVAANRKMLAGMRS